MKKLTLLLTVFFISHLGMINAQSIGDTIHAVHYTINLDEINTSAKTIDGWAEITITPLVDELDYIPLELLDLTVSSVKVDGLQKSYNHDGNRIIVYLDSPVGIGDTLIVLVYYNGQPFHESWGGFHFSGDYAFNLGIGISTIPHNVGKTWFPCIDNFTDRATYDVIGTAETGLTITAGGELVSTVVNGNNTTTWHWQIPHAIPTYLVSIAMGEYTEYTDEYYGIEDTIPISIFTKPSSAGNVAGSYVHLHEIIELFETSFGPYPFEKIGYTGTAIGAMEHVGNIAMPHSTFNGGTSSEYLYAHELSHMWFGNKVTCSTAEDMWLNEGWATFCQMYYKTAIYDNNTFLEEMRETHKGVLKNGHVLDGGYWAANNIPQDVTYGNTAYDKGSTIVNTLKNYLGDSLFFEAITAYLNADGIAYNSVSSYDMRDFLTNYTGIDMKPFFDAWVMSPGTPHFSIDSVLITEGGASYMIDIWTKQKYKGFDFLADNNIVEITIIDEDFNFYTDTIHWSGLTGHSQKIYDMVMMPKKPMWVTMDLFEKTNDATTDNYKYFTEPVEYDFPETYFSLTINNITDSAMIRATHNWVAPDAMIVPVEGLTLSPYRHWKVEGILPDGFDASGSFFYNISGNLDNGLITNNNDSIVILYRPGAGYEWQSISQTRLGVWSVGNIVVGEILPGEYTLAVWDIQIVGELEKKTEDKSILIFPNPSRGNLNFEFPHTGNYHVKFYDESGKLLDELSISSNKGFWECGSSCSTGTVLVEVIENGDTLATRKVMIVK